MAEPRERALDDPPSPIAPQRAPILVGRVFVVPPRRHDRLDTPAGHPRAQRIAVIPPIGNQAFGPFAGLPGLARPSDRHRGPSWRHARKACQAVCQWGSSCGLKRQAQSPRRTPWRPLSPFRLGRICGVDRPPFPAAGGMPGAAMPHRSVPSDWPGMGMTEAWLLPITG